MEEKSNGPFQGSRLPPVPLSSMGKKKEFVIPETECWDDDDEPPFSLQFDLDEQQLKRRRRRLGDVQQAAVQLAENLEVVRKKDDLHIFLTKNSPFQGYQYSRKSLFFKLC